jgi:hypothetical protein
MFQHPLSRTHDLSMPRVNDPLAKTGDLLGQASIAAEVLLADEHGRDSVGNVELALDDGV